jgi:hypothetical protein
VRKRLAPELADAENTCGASCVQNGSTSPPGSLSQLQNQRLDERSGVTGAASSATETSTHPAVHVAACGIAVPGLRAGCAARLAGLPASPACRSSRQPRTLAGQPRRVPCAAAGASSPFRSSERGAILFSIWLSNAGAGVQCWG